MCTAFTLTDSGFYMGRNFDLEYSYGERPTLTPRNYPFLFTDGTVCAHHEMLLGMAYVRDGCPLYYDAMNESGLVMAGLSFPGYAHYEKAEPGAGKVAPHELISYVLTQCKSVSEAKTFLRDKTIADIPVSADLANTPLHWFIADRRASLAVEAMENGLHLWDDPMAVLTNAPPLPFQFDRLRDYRGLSPDAGANRFSPRMPLECYSRGMGAIGLPGDFSSCARFVRAAYVKENTVTEPTPDGCVNRVFHILDSVKVPRGCVRTEEGADTATLYSACFDVPRGKFWYETYDEPARRCVSFSDAGAEREVTVF